MLTSNRGLGNSWGLVAQRGPGGPTALGGPFNNPGYVTSIDPRAPNQREKLGRSSVYKRTASVVYNPYALVVRAGRADASLTPVQTGSELRFNGSAPVYFDKNGNLVPGPEMSKEGGAPAAALGGMPSLMEATPTSSIGPSVGGSPTVQVNNVTTPTAPGLPSPGSIQFARDQAIRDAQTGREISPALPSSNDSFHTASSGPSSASTDYQDAAAGGLYPPVPEPYVPDMTPLGGVTYPVLPPVSAPPTQYLSAVRDSPVLLAEEDFRHAQDLVRGTIADRFIRANPELVGDEGIDALTVSPVAAALDPETWSPWSMISNQPDVPDGSFGTQAHHRQDLRALPPGLPSPVLPGGFSTRDEREREYDRLRLDARHRNVWEQYEDLPWQPEVPHGGPGDYSLPSNPGVVRRQRVRDGSYRPYAYRGQRVPFPPAYSPTSGTRMDEGISPATPSGPSTTPTRNPRQPYDDFMNDYYQIIQRNRRRQRDEIQATLDGYQGPAQPVKRKLSSGANNQNKRPNLVPISTDY